ncbi:ATP synthase subunit s, mitochondrial-like [Biomphalaria glabrata]|uniref:ATP synthase subunit s, mitochondrial-like n=1 Tax=Biomphalaria glabrata TaxID=6526 RepID=A0A9U8ELE5_BIOGL|nr:ATP synthase subunit s, mitochondrial-like [Biomphalaria glabrata]
MMKMQRKLEILIMRTHILFRFRRYGSYAPSHNYYGHDYNYQDHGYVTRSRTTKHYDYDSMNLMYSYQQLQLSQGTPIHKAQNLKLGPTAPRHSKPLLELCPQHFYLSCRSFWGVTVAFNQVDEERVKLAGPDRAAAEWVLRNEGSIKWTTSPAHLNDYNMLPRSDFEEYKLEEIDLSNTKVIDLGFEHLKNLKHLRKVKLYKCVSIMDDALKNLQHVKDTLEHLEIIDCPMITDAGLNHLIKLRNLKVLILSALQDVPDLNKSVNRLKSSMPWCHIVQTSDVEDLKT